MSLPPEVSIGIQDAAWVLISASYDDRHLYDLVWAAEALRSKGVKDDHIFLFVDHPSPSTILTDFKLHTRVRPLDNFERDLPTIGNFKYVFCVSSGHGSHLGIHGKSALLQPAKVLGAMRDLKGLDRGFLILGQCYGGVFDGLEASKQPEIGIMGAAKLSPSVSGVMATLNHPIKLQAPKIDASGKSTVQNLQWSTNVFFFHFFSWIRDPVDTDGDGKLTLLDAYKYAGSKANGEITSMRVMRGLDLDPKLKRAKQLVKDHITGTAPLDPVEFVTQTTILEEEAFLYFHQEPWALHINLVRASVLKF